MCFLHGQCWYLERCKSASKAIAAWCVLTVCGLVCTHDTLRTVCSMRLGRRVFTRCRELGSYPAGSHQTTRVWGIAFGRGYMQADRERVCACDFKPSRSPHGAACCAQHVPPALRNWRSLARPNHNLGSCFADGSLFFLRFAERTHHKRCLTTHSVADSDESWRRLHQHAWQTPEERCTAILPPSIPKCSFGEGQHLAFAWPENDIQSECWMLHGPPPWQHITAVNYCCRPHRQASVVGTIAMNKAEKRVPGFLC